MLDPTILLRADMVLTDLHGMGAHAHRDFPVLRWPHISGCLRPQQAWRVRYCVCDWPAQWPRDRRCEGD